jgi:hypothetical protein
LKPTSEELSIALEALRDRPIVAESRDYAHRWARTRARATSLRRTMFGPAGAIVAACAAAYFIFGLPGVAKLSVKNLLSARNVVETGIGETRVVALDDGSRIVLDTQSRLRTRPAARNRKRWATPGKEGCKDRERHGMAKGNDRPRRHAASGSVGGHQSLLSDANRHSGCSAAVPARKRSIPHR